MGGIVWPFIVNILLTITSNTSVRVSRINLRFVIYFPSNSHVRFRSPFARIEFAYMILCRTPFDSSKFFLWVEKNEREIIYWIENKNKNNGREVHRATRRDIRSWHFLRSVQKVNDGSIVLNFFQLLLIIIIIENRRKTRMLYSKVSDCRIYNVIRRIFPKFCKKKKLALYIS